MKAIYFDMDGTVADLYGVDGWMEMLHAEDTTPYEIAAPLYDMDYLNALLCEFIMRGITIGVITWGAMDGSKEYGRATRKAKKNWLDYWMPCVEEYHCVKYGTPKKSAAKFKDSILVDDNAAVRAGWKGTTLDANYDICELLEILLYELGE